jgi:rare lipoprotein A
MKLQYVWIFMLGLACIGFLPVQASAFAPEFGKATYYANKFHGKKTANGERYDKNELTCAHKKHKFGTLLRVTRLDNGNSVIVRVNDRGPFAHGYIIDLSYAAAEAIDMIKEGVIKVKIEVYDPGGVVKSEGSAEPKKTSENTEKEPEKPVEMNQKEEKKQVTEPKKEAPASAPDDKKKISPTTAPATKPDNQQVQTDPAWQIGVKKAPAQGFAVQLMSLNSLNSTLEAVLKVSVQFPNKVLVREESDGNGNIQYKLLLGAYADKTQANTARKAALKKGYDNCFVISLK